MNKKIVFTNGCFDVIHAGHIDLLRQAKQLGDYLIVAINNDKTITKLKGKDRPYNTEQDRKKILEAIRYVDMVIIYNGNNHRKIIKKLNPDIYVKGGDYLLKKIYSQKYVESYGGKVVIIPYVEGKSSTQVIKQMRKKR